MKTECRCGQQFEGQTITDIEKSFEDHFSKAIENYVDGTLFLHRRAANPLVSAGPGVYYDAETSVKGYHRLLPIPSAE